MFTFSLLKSKRAISDNPISWLNLKLHYKKFEEYYSVILKNYKNKEVIKRLEKVEARGRYKIKKQ